MSSRERLLRDRHVPALECELERSARAREASVHAERERQVRELEPEAVRLLHALLRQRHVEGRIAVDAPLQVQHGLGVAGEHEEPHDPATLVARGGVPERPKGTGCKPVGSAYGGSNPPAPTVTPSAELRRLLDGYRVSQVIYVAMRLGPSPISSAKGHGRATSWPDATGAHPDALHRLLRALASRRRRARGGGTSLRADRARRTAPLGRAGLARRLGRLRRPPFVLAGVGSARAQRAHRRERLPPRPRHRRLELARRQARRRAPPSTAR